MFRIENLREMRTFWIYLRDMVQLIMSPTNGWEDISYDDFDLKKLVTVGFIPWIIIVSLAAIVRTILSTSPDIFLMVKEILVIFIKYFVTYFVAGFAFSVYMPSFSNGHCRESLNNIFIAFSLGLLAVMDLLKECLPIDLAILNFLPLYILLIMWRGGRFVKYAEGHAFGYMVLCFCSVVLPPYLLQLLLNIILP